MIADFVGPGTVSGGDLEAVEEEAGALGVDLVGGEGAEDFGEDDLDGAAVFEQGQGDGRGLRRGGGGSVGYGFGGRDARISAAGLKVEVAEAVSADGDGAAFLSAGTDVLALVVGGVLGDWHGYPPPPPLGGLVLFVFNTLAGDDPPLCG